MVLFVCAYATPLIYDPAALTSAYPARIVTFAMAVAGEMVVMQFLKRRLLTAEARQRRMAELDPLTGLLNRRSFDAALQDVFARGLARQAKRRERRLCCLTLTSSSSSTISTVTLSGTRYCARSQTRPSGSCAGGTGLLALAGTSSRSSPPAQGPTP